MYGKSWYCIYAQNIPSANEFTQEVMSNVSKEYTTCVAYFYIVKEAVGRTSGTPETVSGLNKAAEDAMGFAYMTLVESGKTDEVAQKIITSRIKLAIDDMKKILTQMFTIVLF